MNKMALIKSIGSTVFLIVFVTLCFLYPIIVPIVALSLLLLSTVFLFYMFFDDTTIFYPEIDDLEQLIIEEEKENN